MGERETEGHKLRRALEEAGKNGTALAIACEVSSSMVTKYFQTETFGGHAWNTVCKGLAKLGISPSKIREGYVEMYRERTALPTRDLRPLLDGFSKQQLGAVKEILEADAPSRERLYWVLEDRLGRR